VYGRAQFYSNVGSFIGIASAGVIVSFIGIDVISLISAGICLISVIFAMQIREKNFYSERMENSEQSGEKQPGIFASFFETFKEASLFIKGSRIALISILFMVLFSSLGGYLDEFDAFIINDFGISLVWVSVILTVRTVFVSLGDLLAPKVQSWFPNIGRIFLLSMSTFILLIIFTLIWHQYAILIFGFAFMILTITDILLVNVVQTEIKEEGRATVMSFYSVGQNIAMIGLSLVYGLLAGIFTLQHVYIIISIYGLLGGLCFYLLYNKMKNR